MGLQYIEREGRSKSKYCLMTKGAHLAKFSITPEEVDVGKGFKMKEIKGSHKTKQCLLLEFSSNNYS